MQHQSQSFVANSPDRRASSSRAEIFRIRELAFLVKAHDGLSGAIAERAGFEGVCASGPLNCARNRLPLYRRSPTEPTRRGGRAHSRLDRNACAVDGDSRFANNDNGVVLATQTRSFVFDTNRRCPKLAERDGRFRSSLAHRGSSGVHGAAARPAAIASNQPARLGKPAARAANKLYAGDHGADFSRVRASI